MDAFVSTLKSPFPVIVVEGGSEGMLTLSVVADQQVLFEVESRMVDATMVLFSMYYVFMHKYPASLNNVSTYLQKCIFQIPNGQKLPTSVITFVNSLDSNGNAKVEDK